MKKTLLNLTAAAMLLIPATALAKSKTKTAATTTTTTSTTTGKTSKAAPTSTVHINSGSAADLMTLPGIGQKMAADIIKNRPYKDINDLIAKVKGIGPNNAKKLQPYIDFR